MKKIELKELEENKYLVIKKLVEEGGNKRAAAARLGCSLRNINRMVLGYKNNGKEFFKHGNVGRAPSIALSTKLKEKILNLFKEEYYDFNFKHFQEKLLKKEGIKISYSALRILLIANNICSSKLHKKTKKMIKERLEKKLKEETMTPEVKKEIENSIIERCDAHPRRSRMKNFGEIIQMDASFHLWFGTEKTYLHIGIDDATGMIVGAYFDHQETLKGYYQVTSQILENYGVPAIFLTDRRTVFEYKKLNDQSLENDSTTQFGYACSKLGIEIRTSSVPQAKGRVERAFGTLQSRLIAELRLLNVTDIDSGNIALAKYIKEFNQDFSIPFNFTNSVFEKQMGKEEINLMLSVMCERIIDKGHSIKFDNKHHFPINEKNDEVYLKPKTKVAILKSLNGETFGLCGKDIYRLKEIEVHQRISKEFDLEEVEVEKTKIKWKPAKEHPWSYESFLKYSKKQTHRNNFSV